METLCWNLTVWAPAPGPGAANRIKDLDQTRHRNQTTQQQQQHSSLQVINPQTHAEQHLIQYKDSCWKYETMLNLTVERQPDAANRIKDLDQTRPQPNTQPNTQALSHQSTDTRWTRPNTTLWYKTLAENIKCWLNLTVERHRQPDAASRMKDLEQARHPATTTTTVTFKPAFQSRHWHTEERTEIYGTRHYDET